MIKKLTALLLSLILLCSLAIAETADYTGTWYLVLIEESGISLSPADIGMEMIITLNEDGTGTVVMSGEEDKPAAWVLENGTLTITAEDEPLAFVLTDEGQLAAESGDSKMFFGREPAGPSFIPAAETAAEDITAFDGTWQISTVNAFGMYVPFDAMADMGLTEGSVIIENGSITSFDALETGTFADGKLVVPATDETVFEKSFSLLEDGSLAMTYLEMVFYCDKVETVE